MKDGQQKMARAVEAGIITPDQAEALLSFWQQDNPPDPIQADVTSPMSRFLYYLGALIVIAAMSWLMNTAWDLFHGFGIFTIAVGYAMIFCLMARYFRQKSVVLSGLFVVMAVCMTPLGVFGLQAGLNLWPYEDPGTYKNFYRYIRGGWFTMEVATIAAGFFSLRYSRIPFAMAPIAFALWFMSMDIAPVLSGADPDWTFRKQVSMGFGLLMIGAAVWLERRQQVDYSKWLHIFGAISFWAGLSMLRSDSEFSKFIYCLINVFMMFCGVLLDRKVFLVFGGVGFFGYLGYLSWNVFKDSIAFPFWLTGLGLAVVYLGWIYHRKNEQIQKLVRSITPACILALLPERRRAA